MPRTIAIQHIRTTRANLNTQATANNLKAGEIYLITDENRLAVGLTVSTYEVYAKYSEAGGIDINGLTAKTTPVDADITVIEDSAATWAKKKITWANIKATLKTYFDTLYVALSENQTVNGIKTFGSFPVTPSSAPTTDYQVANKKYVDDNAGGGSAPDYTPAAIAWADVSDSIPVRSSMQQLTGINVPTPIRFQASTGTPAVYINSTNSWSGAILLGANNYVTHVLMPNIYIGIESSTSGTITVTIINTATLATIDTVALTASGGPG